jgi:hypothetical protein
VLAYDLALVDFEALQEAGPAGSGSAPAATGGGSGTAASSDQSSAATGSSSRQ